MNLDCETLNHIARLPASELWSADEHSVAYLATDGKVCSVRSEDPIPAWPEDPDLRSLLRWAPLRLAS